jgi:hypothetical protein
MCVFNNPIIIMLLPNLIHTFLENFKTCTLILLLLLCCVKYSLCCDSIIGKNYALQSGHFALLLKYTSTTSDSTLSIILAFHTSSRYRA